MHIKIDPKKDTYSPEFNSENPDTRPGFYYVSVVDGDRVAFALGPFGDHASAISLVDPVWEIVDALDIKAVWYSFGTCRLDCAPENAKPGVLNEYFGIEEAV